MFDKEEVSFIAQFSQFQSILFPQFAILNELIFSTNAILVRILNDNSKKISHSHLHEALMLQTSLIGFNINEFTLFPFKYNACSQPFQQNNVSPFFQSTSS